MHREPPPLPKLTPRFHLQAAAWIIGAICSVIALIPVFEGVARGRLSAFAVGEAAGTVIVLWLAPLLVAWLTWRLRGRRATTATTAFVATVAVLAFGQFVQRVNRAKARTVAVKTEAEKLARELVQREGAGPRRTTTPVRTAGVDGAREIEEAQRAVEKRLEAAQQRYDAAMAPLAIAPFFELGRLDTDEAVAEQRERVLAFAQANLALQEVATMGAFHFSSALRDHGVPEDAVRKAVTAYRNATEKKLPWVKRMREADARLAHAMLQFLELAKTQRGHWRVAPEGADDGQVVFETPTLQRRFDAIVRQGKLAVEQREFARRQLLAEKR